VDVLKGRGFRLVPETQLFHAPPDTGSRNDFNNFAMALMVRCKGRFVTAHGLSRADCSQWNGRALAPAMLAFRNALFCRG
jgi:hypothetical protein